jgi:small subunit ribosomal protein S5
LAKINPDELELVDKVVHINRVAKVVKGGRRFSFSALVVLGDRSGIVGYGFGKANEVPEAIRKGIQQAKRALVHIPIFNQTIPYQVIGRYGAARVLMKPASQGTGVIAGAAVRAIMECGGVQNILTKCLGSHNPYNMVKATFQGLSQLKTAEEIAEKRGKKVMEILQG